MTVTVVLVLTVLTVLTVVPMLKVVHGLSVVAVGTNVTIEIVVTGVCMNVYSQIDLLIGIAEVRNIYSATYYIQIIIQKVAITRQ